MKIESFSLTQPSFNKANPFEEAAKLGEKQKQSAVSDAETQKAKIAPEELLDKIKALTEDGLYSVRFEKDSSLDQLIVKLVEQDSGEVIRQIPPEELIGLTKKLQELRGAVINTEG